MANLIFTPLDVPGILDGSRPSRPLIRTGREPVPPQRTPPTDQPADDGKRPLRWRDWEAVTNQNVMRVLRDPDAPLMQ